MNNIEPFVDNIKVWTTYSGNCTSGVVDCITFWTKENGIRIDWAFNRNKSIVYIDAIRDSVVFLAKDVNYIIQRALLDKHCRKSFVKREMLVFNEYIDYNIRLKTSGYN
jgi:hypothetical protein